MTEPLSPDDVKAMTVPAWRQVRAAIETGDSAQALVLLDRAVAQWRSLQDYSINWITSLLSFIGRSQGEEAVEAALRATGDEYVRARRDTATPWEELPASLRAKLIARAMLANFGECEVEEDDEKITLSFKCGSGGRMIDEGRYDSEGGPYLTLRQPGPRTFGRDRLPVYCAHCSVNNEMQPLEWGATPTSVEFPSEGPGGRCVHHIYRDPTSLPPEVYQRLGKAGPESSSSVER
ncbi:MAG TPA: hypothetical protein VNY84_00715 [Acidimicrobiales bacterium]|jgi:hypothetical protein|nr:hypothetical protein [Acidimicrobiales bacterium]